MDLLQYQQQYFIQVQPWLFNQQLHKLKFLILKQFQPFYDKMTLFAKILIFLYHSLFVDESRHNTDFTFIWSFYYKNICMDVFRKSIKKKVKVT